MSRRSTWIIVAVLAPFFTSTPNCSAVAQSNAANQTCYRDANNGDYSGAVTECTNAINLNPNDESAYANRCFAYGQLSNFNAAIIDCTRAIALNPNDLNAYDHRCAAYSQSGNVTAGVPDCTHAANLNPSDFTAYFWLCYDNASEGNASVAIADCTKAIELNPQYAYSYSDRCDAYVDENNYSAVIADCTKAIQLDSQIPSAYNDRCIAYHAQKDYHAAIADCTKAISLDPNYQYAYDNRCNAYVDQGDLAAALADCTKAIGLNVKDEFAYTKRCDIFYRQGNFSAAQSDCAQAISMDSNNQEAIALRAKLAQQASAGAGNPPPVASAISRWPEIHSWPEGIKDLPCAAFLRLQDGGWKTASPLNVNGAPISITTQANTDETKMIDARCAASAAIAYAGAGVTIAPSGSAVDKVGQFILGKVAGRTIDDMANVPAGQGWLDILHQPLLDVAGVSSFAPFDSPLANGQLSIDDGFGVPGYGQDDLESFDQSDPRTPPAMEFAFERANLCYGGYVAGYPVPNKVYAVNMGGEPCSATTVHSAIRTAYLKAIGESGN